MKKKTGRGGARPNSGPEKGSGEKTKICVSVTETIWQSALSIWRRENRKKKPSWLVNKLAEAYVETGGGILETEAA